MSNLSLYLYIKDIMTDLNAESEILPLYPPREDFTGHKVHFYLLFVSNNNILSGKKSYKTAIQERNVGRGIK